MSENPKHRSSASKATLETFKQKLKVAAIRTVYDPPASGMEDNEISSAVRLFLQHKAELFSTRQKKPAKEPS